MLGLLAARAMRSHIWWLGLLLLMVAAGCRHRTAPPLPSGAPIRIGWQIPWATQGQLAAVLKHGDVAKKYGLVPTLKGFTYGPPLNEAALAGEVDVFFTADQPAATLLSRSDEFRIIGRLMYNRVAIYVPPDSPLQTVGELKGKTVGMPVGAAAQREALKAMQQAGLNPEADVHMVNMDINEQSDLVRSPEEGRWGRFDALVGFDPTPAIFEKSGKARMLHVGQVVSVVMARRDYVDNNRPAVVAFLKALRDAYLFFSKNPTQADDWYEEESRMDASEAVLDLCASVEPNAHAQTPQQVRLGFTDADYAALQDAADFIWDHKMAKQRVDMKSRVDLGPLEESEL